MEIKSKMIDLIRAFDEARLAALHIDMQLQFHEHICYEGRTPTEKIFPVVNQFAKDLRALDITNHWVAYTGAWAKSQYGAFKTDMAKTRALRMFPSMAQDDELVFEKAEQWAFQDSNCILTDHLNSAVTNTLIIDGVKDIHCVKHTITTGLEKGFCFYVALDATNCPTDKFDEFVSWFNKEITDDEKKMVTFTSTAKILSTLEQAQKQQNLGLVASVG